MTNFMHAKFVLVDGLLITVQAMTATQLMMGRAVAARTRAAADVLFGAICHRHPRINGELTSIAFRVPTPYASA